MRKYGKVDLNQNEIVSALQKFGTTISLASVGRGCPDLIFGYKGRNYLLEIKNGKQAKLTPDQEEFFAAWSGHVCIIRSIDDVIEFVDELHSIV
jgi:Holliday junction resolvase